MNKIFTNSYNYLLSLNNIPRTEYMSDPNACKGYMVRMQKFLDILGNPEKKIPHYIHITGTSGKGSTTNYLHSILNESGTKIGSMISPHPTEITERWRIGNKDMSKAEFVTLTEKAKKALQTFVEKYPKEDVPSFFEITTAMGLLYFAKNKCTWVILEVGCGGRYDSTNIIPHKDVAIITNIDLDHTHILGNTREKIAYEKAGIISKNCKVFSAEPRPSIKKIISVEAQKNKAKLKIIDTKQINSLSLSNFTYKNIAYNIKALGSHQHTNAALAIEVAESLGIKKNIIKKAIKKTLQPLRTEIIKHKPYIIIIDGAHNEAKMETTVKTLQAFMSEHKIGSLKIIIGFSQNKQWTKMLSTLITLRPTEIIATRNTTNPFRQITDPRKIAKAASQKKIKTSTYLNPQDALDYGIKKLKKHDILLVTGSIFLSGELRPYIR